MKCICYARVSTVGQSEDGISLEMQESRARAWAAANNYEIEAVFVETMSGGRASNRPELQHALTRTEKIKGVLVVYSLSRLARSVTDALAIVERLNKSGASLASITERIDTNSAVGKLFLQMMLSLAEFEKNQNSERTTGAMSFMRRNNKRISAKIPFGYNLTDDGISLTPNPEEQQTLAYILKQKEQGNGLSAIARALNQQGIKTKYGSIWHPATIKAIAERYQKLAA